MANPPAKGYWAEWIKPADGFSGTHVFVTDGTYAFDYHGYSCRENLLNHHWQGHQRLHQGWSATISRVDFSLLDTRELNARQHLGPDQYYRDPRPRAARFVARFEPPKHQKP